MKTLRRILGFAIAALLLVWLYSHFFPNEDKRVRRVLDGVAQSASIPAKVSPVTLGFNLDRLQGYLSRDVLVTVDVPIEGRHTFSGREELMEAMKAAWGTVRGVKVEFLDTNITFDESRQNATAELTAQVTQAGQKEFWVQELKFQLAKLEDQWRITRIETVRALQR